MAQPQQTRQQPTGTAVVVKAPPRLAYPSELGNAGVDEGKWRVLTDAIFPSAKTIEAVRLAIDYCQSRKLDIMKRPVHIVPMYSTALRKMVETVWPSVSEIRTTAARTGEYAGCDEAVFGDEITETFTGFFDDDNGGRQTKAVKVTFPSWCRVTVYRFVRGQRVPFPGPRVLWKESYGRIGKTELPNDMWQKRAYGQIEKCAEVAALRKAFPEEVGNEYAAEEMEGREIAAGQWAAVPAEAPAPPRPTREQFTPAQVTKPDGATPTADVIDVETTDDPPSPKKVIKPVRIPVNEETGEADWPKWQGAVLAAILRCPDVDTLTEWWAAQAPAFEDFATEHPTNAGAMQETVDLRIKALEGAPGGK